MISQSILLSSGFCIRPSAVHPKLSASQTVLSTGLPASPELKGGPEQGLLPGCRYGYSNVQQLTRVVQSYEYFKIPLETFVTDSQYMDHDQDFTISPDFEPWGVSALSSSHRMDACSACFARILRYEHALSLHLKRAAINLQALMSGACCNSCQWLWMYTCMNCPTW